MKKIKTLFRSLSLSSEYDKILLKIIASDDFLKPTEDMIAKIRDALEGQDQEINQQKAVQEFFSQLKMQENWTQAMKILYILHKLIHMMKLNVTYMITENDIAAELKSNLKISSQSDEIHVPIVLKYYQFLKQIAKYFTQFYESEQYFQSENLEYLKQKRIQDIINTLTCLQSILKNIFKATQNLSFSLQNYQKYEITKYVGLMIIKDAIMIYDFVSEVMTTVKDRILYEEDNISLKLYETYEETVILSKNIEKLHDLRNFTFDPYIKKPRYFKIDKDNNRQIELHINQIHKKINNTNNVVATVSKSVNESTIQQQSYQKEKEIQVLSHGGTPNKYIAENHLSTKRKQESSRPLKQDNLHTSSGSYSNRFIQTELVSLNQRSQNDVDVDEERVELSNSPNKIISGHNMSNGQQFFIPNYRNPEIGEEQNKEEEYFKQGDDEDDNDNLCDNDGSENERIFINNLCTKNDKIQPVVKKENRSSVVEDQKHKNNNQAQQKNQNGQIQRGLSQSNSIINLMFENSKKSLEVDDDLNNHKIQPPTQI